MSTKKALIINIQNHNYAGGIETYSRKIMPILQECGYEIYEYSTCKNIQTKVCEKFSFVNQVNVEQKILLQTEDVIKTIPWYKRFRALINDAKALIYQRKHLKEIVKDYDMVIDNSTIINSISDEDHKNLIWIQHNDFLFLKKIGQPLRSVLKKLLKLKFPYMDIKRKVVYSEASVELYRKIFPKQHFDYSQFYEVFLASKVHEYEFIDIEKKRMGPIVFMGRLKDVGQKRTDIADKVAKHLPRPVFAYGSYEPGFENKYKHLTFKGKYSSDKDLPKIFENAALTLITSDYEGACFLAVESIAHETPIVVRNTFAEVRYLLKNDNGLLIDKSDTPKLIAKKINQLVSNSELYKNIFEQNKDLKNKFSNEMFVEKWKEIIKKIESE